MIWIRTNSESVAPIIVNISQINKIFHQILFFHSFFKLLLLLNNLRDFERFHQNTEIQKKKKKNPRAFNGWHQRFTLLSFTKFLFNFYKNTFKAFFSLYYILILILFFQINKKNKLRRKDKQFKKYQKREDIEKINVKYIFLFLFLFSSIYLHFIQF